MSPVHLYTACGIVAATCIGCYYYSKAASKNTAPWVRASTLQTLKDFGNDPVTFLIRQRKELGDVFRINLLFFSITFIIGPKWNRWLLKETKEEEASFYEAVRDMHHGLIDVAYYYPGWMDRALKAMSIAEYHDCYGEHIMTMVTAAHANSDGTFCWTLLHLLRNPELLAEFEREIKSNPPVEGRYPIKNMPFSEACLRETGRLYSNLANVRWVPRDIEAPGGIIIPRGWLAASPLVTQRDPELYHRPEEWEPHRFLSKDPASSYSSKFRNHEFVQFGYGRHACLGEKLTHSLLRETLWPTLIDNYRLEVVDGAVDGEGLSNVGVDITFSEGLGTPFGKREVWIKVTQRDLPLSAASKNSVCVASDPLPSRPIDLS